MLKRLKNSFFLLISTFFILYFFFNLMSVDRGLISYNEKKQVLDDLKKRSHFFNTTHVKGDSHESAYYEGQRSLVVFIESLLNQKE